MVFGVSDFVILVRKSEGSVMMFLKGLVMVGAMGEKPILDFWNVGDCIVGRVFRMVSKEKNCVGSFFERCTRLTSKKKVVVFVKRYLVIGERSFDGSQRYVFSKRNPRFRISDLLSGFEFSNVSKREC